MRSRGRKLGIKDQPTGVKENIIVITPNKAIVNSREPKNLAKTLPKPTLYPVVRRFQS